MASKYFDLEMRRRREKFCAKNAFSKGKSIGVSLLLSAVINRIVTLKVLACSIWMLENSNKLDFTSNYMREHLDTTKCFLHHQKQEIPKWAQHDLGRNMR